MDKRSSFRAPTPRGKLQAKGFGISVIEATTILNLLPVPDQIVADLDFKPNFEPYLRRIIEVITELTKGGISSAIDLRRVANNIKLGSVSIIEVQSSGTTVRSGKNPLEKNMRDVCDPLITYFNEYMQLYSAYKDIDSVRPPIQKRDIKYTQLKL